MTKTSDKNRRDLAKLMADRNIMTETLLAQVKAGVAATNAGYQADQTNWGFAGNLGHAIDGLDDLAKFLGQKGVR